MNKKLGIILAVVVGIIAVALIIYALSRPATTSTTAGNANSTATAPTEQKNGKTATIVYTNDGFDPTSLTVSKGTTIKVVNNSSRDLQYSSGQHPTHHEDPEINMSVLHAGESGTFVVETVGTHTFHDHLDASQEGTLIVTE